MFPAPAGMFGIYSAEAPRRRMGWDDSALSQLPRNQTYISGEIGLALSWIPLGGSPTLMGRCGTGAAQHGEESAALSVVAASVAPKLRALFHIQGLVWAIACEFRDNDPRSGRPVAPRQAPAVDCC